MSIPTGPQEYMIGHAEQAESFTTKAGHSLIKWKIGLQLGEQKWWPAETNRQPSTPAPVVGDTIYGILSEGPYGLKFAKEKRPQPSNEVRAAEAQASADKTEPVPGSDDDPYQRRPENPVDAARKNRAHAQEMSLRYLALRVQAGIEKPEGVTPERVRQMTTWFASDVAESHTEPSSATSTPSPTTNHVPVATQAADSDIPF